MLSPQNELFLTLMKLRLNLNSQFLGHLFGISQSLVTAILSTWIPLLALELKPLIHWPTREEAQHYYPDCFQKYKNVIAIIDCTKCQFRGPHWPWQMDRFTRSTREDQHVSCWLPAHLWEPFHLFHLLLAVP